MKHGCSSVGRALVSKTRCREFESLLPCKKAVEIQLFLFYIHFIFYFQPKLEPMNVDVFIPCFIDQFYPETAVNFIKVLKKAGCEVNYNPEQTCCGQPSFNSGYWKETRTLAIKFLNDFQRLRNNCFSFCFLHRIYKKLLSERFLQTMLKHFLKK